MKIFPKLLIFVFLAGCNMKNKGQEHKNSDPVWHKLIGFYEYQAPSGGSNQYILIDTIKGKYYGIYYRSEAKRAKGHAYFANSLSKLQFAGDTVSFVLGDRKLFSSRPVVPGKKTGNIPQTTSAISASALKFKGSFLNNLLKLQCNSGNGNCPDNLMNFRKIPLPN